MHVYTKKNSQHIGIELPKQSVVIKDINSPHILQFKQDSDMIEEPVYQFSNKGEWIHF